MKKLLSRSFVVGLMMMSFYGGDAYCKEPEQDKVKIGVAWRADVDSEFYTNICDTLRSLGAEPVLLPQVKAKYIPYGADGNVHKAAVAENDYLANQYAAMVKEKCWQDSNASSAVKDVAAVIFTGGEDISPTLYAAPEPWHGILEEQDYNATRDVSDYLLLKYCLDKDIPMMGFCRGAQMLGIVSGATVIQDIPRYFAENGLVYRDEHRRVKQTPDEYRDYAPHTVKVTDKDSRFFSIFKKKEVKVTPSWHHQALKGVLGTNLKITGVTATDRLSTIECIERTDKRWAIGMQFHPEAAVVKHINGSANAKSFMAKKQGNKPFVALMKYVQGKK